MTRAQFEKQLASTFNHWVGKMIKKFQTDVVRLGEKEARLHWREEYGLSFVKEYTVAARFRHYKPFPWKEMPTTSKKTLEAQQKQKQKQATKQVAPMRAAIH
jgi:hypothetical protein